VDIEIMLNGFSRNTEKILVLLMIVWPISITLSIKIEDVSHMLNVLLCMKFFLWIAMHVGKSNNLRSFSFLVILSAQ
jgi:hypothetical protein